MSHGAEQGGSAGSEGVREWGSICGGVAAGDGVVVYVG